MRKRLIGIGLLAAWVALAPGLAAAAAAEQTEPAPENAPEKLTAALSSGVVLSKGRVKVSVTFRDPYTGRTGTAVGALLVDEFAYFTFSSESNPEVVVKVLGGNTKAGLQLYAAGVTNFEYTVTFHGCGTERVFFKPAYAKVTYTDSIPFPTEGCRVFSSSLDATHTVTVRQDAAGKVVYMSMSRDLDGRKIGTVFPYGRHLSGKRGVGEQRMTVTELKALLAIPPPKGVGAANSSPYTLGYNTNIGPTSGACFNYSSVAPSLGTMKLQNSFSSQNTASSFSGQTSTQDSISMGFGGFKSSDSFSFSESNQSSTNTAAIYFNGYALYTMNAAVVTDPKSVLTDQGNGALNADNFAALCGVQYMASVPAGMLVTGGLTFSSASSATSQKISNTMKASYSLEKLSAAVSNATSSSDKSISMNFEFQALGGGQAAAGTLLTGLSSAVNNYLGKCAAGTVSSCDSFSSAADAAVATALKTFTDDVGNGNDYTSLAPFPNGVQGVPLATLQTLPAYSSTNFLGPYAAQMTQTMTLLNQVASLDNRVHLYFQPMVNQPNVNPTSLMDFTQYLDQGLHPTYSAAVSTLLADLTQCLENSKSKTVASDCAAVVNDAKIASAYDYFAPTGPGNNWMAQQNAIALQWVGATQGEGSFLEAPYYPAWPQDILYVDSLPPFANTPGAGLSGQSAIVTISDQDWGYPTMFGNWQFIYPMPAEVGVGKIFSPNILQPMWSFAWANLMLPFEQSDWQFVWFHQGDSIAFTTGAGCTPTIANPCVVGMNMNYAESPAEYWSTTFTPISGFFQ